MSSDANTPVNDGLWKTRDRAGTGAPRLFGVFGEDIVMVSTNAEVCIIESLGFFDEQDRREGEIIYRSLKMTGKSPHYIYVRSRQELEAFLKEYADSPYRYLHLSCHGNENGFATTTDFVPTGDLVALLHGVNNKRRLFVSSCLACTPAFGKALVRNSKWLSVVGPVGEIKFDDATIFWTAFYHTMFKKDADNMANINIQENISICSKVVGQSFRFVRMKGGKPVSGEI